MELNREWLIGIVLCRLGYFSSCWLADLVPAILCYAIMLWIMGDCRSGRFDRMKLFRGLYNLTQAAARQRGDDRQFRRRASRPPARHQPAEACRRKPATCRPWSSFSSRSRSNISPRTGRPRLSRAFREKIAYLKAQEIDYLLCLHFNQALAEQSAEEFVQRNPARQTQYAAPGHRRRFPLRQEPPGQFRLPATEQRTLRFRPSTRPKP